MASTIYRRQSMAQLYEKLRAQDDDDDMAWLAQYSPDDKFDEPYVPPAHSPPSLSSISSISSGSSASSYSSPASLSDPILDRDSSDDYFDFDSDSDVDPEPVSLDSPCTALDVSSGSPVILETHDLVSLMESSDPLYITSGKEESVSPSRASFASIESDSSDSLPEAIPSAPFTVSRRSTRNPSPGNRLTVVIRDPEDAYSDSDGNESEDEYVPSPTLGSRKRHRSARSDSSTSVGSPRRRTTQVSPRKRPRPLPRNVQAAARAISESPAAKNNSWACPYCKWVQRNHRTPDLKRHIRTHTRLQRPAQWVCCGIPVKDARDYNIPAGAEPYLWEGEGMIGGCCKEFSRRDALKRHLDNDHIRCVGNFSVFASICEDEL